MSPAATEPRGEGDRVWIRERGESRRKGSGSSLTGVGRVGLQSLSEVTGAAFPPRDWRLAGAGNFEAPSNGAGRNHPKTTRKDWCLAGSFFQGRSVARRGSCDFLFWSPGMQQLEKLSCGRATASEPPPGEAAGEPRAPCRAAIGRKVPGPGVRCPRGTWLRCFVGFSYYTSALGSWGHRELVGHKAP